MMVEGTTTNLVRFGLQKVIDIYKENRREKLIQKIESGEIKLSDTDAKNDNFIASYLALEAAIFKCTSEQKANALISLFTHGVNSKKIFSETDIYIESITILSELSYEEISLLNCLKEYKPNKSIDSCDYKLASNQLDFFMTETGLSLNMIKARVIRLKRTGLILSKSELSTSMNDQRQYSPGFEAVHLSDIAKSIFDVIHLKIEHSI